MTWTHQDLIVQTAENSADIENLLNRYSTRYLIMTILTMKTLFQFPLKIIRLFWKPSQILL